MGPFAAQREESDMKTAIVGSTGFVGSNLRKAYPFDGQFHSTNIREAYGMKPDLLVYAGVRSEMFLANRDPAADMERIRTAAENIRRIAPRRIVLISTVAVYARPAGWTEDSVIELENLQPYGWNRYFLECWVQDNFKEHLIVRLPALFGENLKKNFLYDYIHVIPRMLREEKYEELARKSERIRKAYLRQENGFYACRDLTEEERCALKEEFQRENFTALHFTDSRSKYQFYHLRHLWDHIRKALDCGIRKLNVVTEPVEISELYQYLTGREFNNPLPGTPYSYDLRTKYDKEFGGRNGYLYDKEFILREIRDYIGEKS